MTDQWTDAELDRWFRAEVLGPSGATEPHEAVARMFELPRDHHGWPRLTPELRADETFRSFWRAFDALAGEGGFRPERREGMRQWDDLSIGAKRQLRLAWEARQTPEDSIVDDLGGTATGGTRLRLPLMIGGAVVVLAVIVGSGAFRGDGTVATPDPTSTAAPSADDVPDDGDGDGEPTSTLPPPRPATDEPVTVTFTGDDPCGVGAGLTALGINIAPRPGPQGGEIAFFGPAGPDPFALTGTLLPGPDGPVWEDRGDDLQAFNDVTVADGTIAGDLDWTDESGCASTIELRIGVPGEVTTWWGLLPPFAAADASFAGSLTVQDGVATLVGTLSDSAGNPVEGQALTVQLYGEDGLGEAIETFSGPGGLVELMFTAPDGDVFSVSVVVAKGAHAIGNVFASTGG